MPVSVLGTLAYVTVQLDAPASTETHLFVVVLNIIISIPAVNSLLMYHLERQIGLFGLFGYQH